MSNVHGRMSGDQADRIALEIRGPSRRSRTPPPGSAARRIRDAPEGRHRLSRVVGPARSKSGRSALMSSTWEIGNLNITPVVSRAPIGSNGRIERARSTPTRAPCAAEQIARDAPGIAPVEIGRKIECPNRYPGASRKIQSSICQMHPPGAALERRREHEAARGNSTRSSTASATYAEYPVDIALPEVNRERGAHEDGVEILAADQAGVLHAAVRRIHRRKQRAGLNSCSGSTTKLSAAAISTMAARARPHRFLTARTVFEHDFSEPCHLRIIRT